MLRYEAASAFWRMVPVRLAERAWRRRGLRIARRAVRRVPACNRLARILTGSRPDRLLTRDDMPALQTGWDSYVDVFPVEKRCRASGREQPVCLEAVTDPAGRRAAWPRAADELHTLREQLVSVLRSRFRADRRRTLLVLALPEVGWCSASRVGQALHDAAARGQLRASIVDRSPEDQAQAEPLPALAGQYEQYVLLAPTESIERHLPAIEPWGSRAGLLVFGPMMQRPPAAWLADASACCLWGIDEAGPLIAQETPLARLVYDACRNVPDFQEQLLAHRRPLAGVYQPFARGPYVEDEDDKLLISAWGLCPLLRYRTGQSGRVVPFEHVWNLLRERGRDSAWRMRRLAGTTAVPHRLPLILLTQA